MRGAREVRNAEQTLTILEEKSKKDKQYTFKGLYRNLYNPTFYLKAYSKIQGKEGNMTAGADGETIDGFNLTWISEIIDDIKKEKYQPTPVRRKYIPKKDGKQRPLGIPSIKDKIVQEVLRQILEAIYEPIFLNCSHGFRPNRSCHTILTDIKKISTGAVWAIEGDIKGFFDNINHDTLLSLLRKKIDDGRLLELIARFLKAGYLENETKYNTYSGTPQGGIISPILANIYLHELDIFVSNIIGEFNKGTYKKKNPQYMKWYWKRRWALEKGRMEKAQEYLNEMRKLPVYDPFDPDYVKVDYYRYADDFVIFISGSKRVALEIRERIRFFLKDNLQLELNMNKTFITHMEDKVRFLGYEITKIKDNTYLTKGSDGVKRRNANGKIALLVPYDVIKDKIQKYSKNGKPANIPARISQTVLETLIQYNAEIRGLYNYYCLANNVAARIHWFKYYHYTSLLKTIANKEKTSTTKVISKYGVETKRKDGQGTRKIFGVQYETKKGTKTLTYFNEPLIKIRKPKVDLSDSLPDKRFMYSSLAERILASECELCGKSSDNPKDFEVHHIRKLKDVKNKYKHKNKPTPKWVVTMSAKNRKTLIVCKKCHLDIHGGRYDGTKLTSSE